MRASTMLRALALCGLLSAPSAMRSGCGVSHWSPAETVVQTQAYGASPPAASASASASDARAPPPPPPPPRGLQQTQVYTGTAFDYPAAQAAALGLLAPLRLVPVYDVIQAGDENSTFTEFNSGGAARRLRQCNAVGQVVWVVAAQSSASESTMTCGAQHVVTGAAGAARYAALVARTEAARKWWQAALQLRPVKDAALAIAPYVIDGFSLPFTAVASADLVIFVTARPSPNVAIAGYATCLQRDQWMRCTVGWLNWVPELLSPSTATYDSTIESEMHTALHEITHVLGGLNPIIGSGASVTSMFLRWPASIYPSAPVLAPPSSLLVYEKDTAFPTSGRTIVKVATPRVLNVTRLAYNCPNATGLALEDIPLGVAAHWEARVTGGEYMSYGTGSSQALLSDLTLSYLADTEQYLVNFSYGGLLFPSSSTSALSGNLGVPMAAPGVVAAKPLSPGWPLYGRGAGCGFLTGPPAIAWPPAYTCSAAGTYGCSPDNRMSSVCIINGNYNTEPAIISMYINASTGTLSPGMTNLNAPGVPSAFAFFSSAQAVVASNVASATASSTGGFSNALDFVPVQVGYWSCNQLQSSTSTTAVGAESSGASLNAFASLFGVTTDMASFAGQARCSNCRCMKSSLLPILSSLVTSRSSYGLCYLTNCVSSSYVQIGVLGQFDPTSVNWYACPPSGGPISIVGYTGVIICPVATTFCALESPTALLYPETNFLWSMIVVGLSGGAALVVFFFCTCGMTRDCFIACCKRGCGALQFETDYIDEIVVASSGAPAHILLVVSHGSDNIAPSSTHPDILPSSVASWTLWGINLVTLCLGLVAAGYFIYAIAVARIYSAGIVLLTAALGVIVLSYIGWMASRRRAEYGPSCWLLTYVAVSLLLLAALVWVVAYEFSSVTWQSFVSTNFSLISSLLPSSCTTGASFAAAVASAQACLSSHVAVLGAAAICFVLMLLAGLVAAATLLHISTFSSLVLTVWTHAAVAAGLLLIIAASYVLTALGTVAGRTGSQAASIAGAVLGSGIFLLASGTLGLLAIFRKQSPLIIAYAFVLGVTALFWAACVWLFLSQSSTIVAGVASLPDAQVALLANALGVSASKATLQASLPAILLQLGIAAAILLAIYLGLVAAALAFLHFNDVARGAVAKAKAPLPQRVAVIAPRSPSARGEEDISSADEPPSEVDDDDDDDDDGDGGGGDDDDENDVEAAAEAAAVAAATAAAAAAASASGGVPSGASSKPHMKSRKSRKQRKKDEEAERDKAAMDSALAAQVLERNEIQRLTFFRPASTRARVAATVTPTPKNLALPQYAVG